MSKSRFINKSHVRTGNQSEIMDEIEKEGVCPFCEENLERFHGKPVVEETQYWSLLEAKWPYSHARAHLLLVASRHMEDISELEPEEWKDMLELAQWASNQYKIAGGALALRFGDSNLTGATVHHLHAHLIEPEADEDGKAKLVNFPIG
ncbi:MAG: hypothetical protein COT89_03110 [Candidatus Colwellbacteria bacterium CG10_big_fil_rev_8_21_14_0_10_42_22]|uniref:HIT domain-containing protein n=1 Tax=Candidatus Colwellbacteria bacterium CG10_big_fil_rev_8_21_14_0_10_42_22 TaxID=1974540 RepID=A0A2H0VF65_9BACT|nr:MAG: hypothetical protein COT89_03110 [Candidatus Colwellbacteria bacterium CG10_big_fil_rev_8_21_14_0_10_42_22]